MLSIPVYICMQKEVTNVLTLFGLGGGVAFDACTNFD